MGVVPFVTKGKTGRIGTGIQPSEIAPGAFPQVVKAGGPVPGIPKIPVKPQTFRSAEQTPRNMLQAEVHPPTPLVCPRMLSRAFPSRIFIQNV